MSSTQPSWLGKVGRAVFKLVRTLLPLHAASWKASSDPIKRLLNIDDVTEKDRLTTLWKDNSLSQLNFIGVTSALIGAVITSAFSWPALASLDESTMSTVRAIWYSALLFAVGSIGSAAQQAVFLNRLSSCPDGPARIRQVLGLKTSNGCWRTRKLQLVIWQTPLSMLNSSMVMFVVGLIVLICKSFKHTWSFDDKKVFGIFLSTLIYTAAMYSMSSYGLYMVEQNTLPIDRAVVIASEPYWCKW